jgi:hypothetical protein
MPTQILPLFGTPGVDVVITLASLANGAARESTAWDWSAYEDILLEVTLKAAVAGVSVSGTCTVYAYATADNGTTYTEAATGTDAAYTMLNPTQLMCAGVVFLNTNAQVKTGGPWSLAALFGGTLPAKGGMVIVNDSGAALDATGSNHLVQYQGVTRQIVTS